MIILQDGEIYFNNNSNLDFNLRLTEFPKIPRCNEEIEKVNVEGRSGDLIIKKGTYSDREISLSFSINSEDIYSDFDLIEEWLTDIDDNRLIIKDDFKIFLVKNVTIGDFTQELEELGSFDVKFLCDPFRYDMESIITEITSSGYSFYYGGNIPSEPLIKVYGNGNIQLIINGETMQINNVNSYVEIDSKLMQVRNQDGTSKDFDTLGDFPMFIKGDNTISYTGTVTKIITEYKNTYR